MPHRSSTKAFISSGSMSPELSLSCFLKRSSSSCDEICLTLICLTRFIPARAAALFSRAPEIAASAASARFFCASSLSNDSAVNASISACLASRDRAKVSCALFRPSYSVLSAAIPNSLSMCLADRLSYSACSFSISPCFSSTLRARAALASSHSSLSFSI